MHILLTLITALGLLFRPLVALAQTLQQSESVGMDTRNLWIWDNYLGESKYTAYANIIAETKVKYVRIMLPWNAIQPTAASTIDWTRPDELFAALKTAGLEPVVILRQAPPWASETPNCDEGNNSTSEYCLPKVADYKNFVSAAVSRYGYDAGGKKEVEYWEILNEPDTKITPVQYAPLIQSVYPVIKSIDPQAQVLLAGLTQYASSNGNCTTKVCGIDWLKQLLSITNIAQNFDIVSIHLYGTSTQMSGYISQVKTTLTQYGVKKPVWLTEFNFGSGNYQPAGGQCPKDEINDEPYFTQLPTFLSKIFQAGADKAFYHMIGCSRVGPGIIDTNTMPGSTPSLAIRPNTRNEFLEAIKPYLYLSIPGDLNGDTHVNGTDYQIFFSNFGNTTCGNVADIDGNCKVDIFDYNVIVGNFGK